MAKAHTVTFITDRPIRAKLRDVKVGDYFEFTDDSHKLAAPLGTIFGRLYTGTDTRHYFNAGALNETWEYSSNDGVGNYPVRILAKGERFEVAIN